ncbi:MAG: AAA family ATPase [Gammaproteobacteria bacterium]|nr:AAA family ATPase [Gammaproteobacteria bacterium]
MYIRRVVIENIRGFRELDFNFQRPDGSCAGWSVITGDNASGKTALLRAIGLALTGIDTAHTLLPSFEGWIHAGADKGVVSVQLEIGTGDGFATAGARYKKPFWAELQFVPIGQNKVKPESANLFRGKNKGPARGLWSDTAHGWFCAGYGPFRRLYGHSPEAQRLMSTQGKVARFATLFREDATLSESDLWLKELDHRQLRDDVEARKTLDTVSAILNKGFFPNGIQVERVDDDGLWLRQTNATVLVLQDMSDGFRSAAALVMDILKHLADIYGIEDLVNLENGSVTHSGVVLIDEIDAHLHPEWQRKIGDWFKRIFPNIQFIVTTHSALICQAADENGIFHLPAPGEEGSPCRLAREDYDKIIAGKPDTIYISPAFGLAHTRSPRAVEARREYSRLESKKLSRKLSPRENERQLKLALFVDEE